MRNLFPILAVTAIFHAWMFAMGSWVVAAPMVGGFPTIHVSEIRPGMVGEVHTVMQGSEIVVLRAEIDGVLRGALGPGFDMIIGRLVDERTALTGAVHGMSGSPLFIDGRLAGALSRRLMMFEKDGHCGFTPVADMVDVVERGVAAKANSRTARLLNSETRGFVTLGSQVTKGFSESAQAIWTGGGGRTATPSHSPLLVPLSISGGGGWGFLERWVGEWFPGMVPVAGGTSSSSTSPASATAAPLPPIRPGSPLAVVLMDGDISIAGTGTTTWVDGNRVAGFGHPMLGLGATRLPIAPAEIITVVPSYLTPHKISNAGPITGTLDQDRLSAVSGRIGPIPQMVDYRVTRRHNGGARPSWTGRLIDHPQLAPQLITMLAARAMGDAQDVSEMFSLRVRSVLRFDHGLPDLSLDGFYTGGAANRMEGLFGQMMPVMQLFSIFGDRLVLREVVIDVESQESGVRWVIDSIATAADQCRVGEPLGVLIGLRDQNGRTKQLRMDWSAPEELRGQQILLEAVGGWTINRQRRFNLHAWHSASPQDAITFLNRSTPQHMIRLRGTRLYASGADLPHSVRQLNQALPTPPHPALLDRPVYGERSAELDGMVDGSASTSILIQ